MDKIISQLTHDNDLFDEQWSNIYDRLQSISLSTDGKPVLCGLVDYILADPIDPPPDQIKYTFIQVIFRELDSDEISLDTVDLVNAFIRVLQSPSIDSWRLEFLTMLYKKFRIGERISSHASKDQFLQEILQHLQQQTFETHEDKWQTFLVEYLFSPLTDESNSLNQIDRQSQFELFYKHALAHSEQSSIWSKITTILRETVFPDQVLKTDPMIEIENCISQHRYSDARSIVTHLDFTTVDLNTFVRSIIRYCSMVTKEPDAFCSDFLSSCVIKLVDLTDDKQYGAIFFELALAALKVFSLKAPDAAYRLLRKTNFYSWKDLIDGLIEMVRICISYETMPNENNFSDLDELENILEVIAKRCPTYPQLSAIVQPLALEAILRWGDCHVNRGHHVYRMGCVLFQCIHPKQITEEICVKFIDIFQAQINADWKDDQNKTRFFFNVNLFFFRKDSLLPSIFISLSLGNVPTIS